MTGKVSAAQCPWRKTKKHYGPGERSKRQSSWMCHLPAGHTGDHQVRASAHQTPAGRWENTVTGEVVEQGPQRLSNPNVRVSRNGTIYDYDPERRERAIKNLRRVMELLPDIPVVDAEEPAFIEVAPNLTKVCRWGDPKRCVLTRAWERSTNTDIYEVYTWHSQCVVLQVGSDGEARYVRYELAKATRKAVEEYDQKPNHPFPDGTYRFSPPSIGHGLGARYKRENKSGPRLSRPRAHRKQDIRKREAVELQHLRERNAQLEKKRRTA